MIERFECRGMWWLPQFPDKKISGTLTFTPERGAMLDLDGSFVDGDLKKRDLEEFDIVLGISLDNKEVTLARCFVVRRSGYFVSKIVPPPQRSSLYVSKVFAGAHFNKLDDIRFRSVSVRYSYLDEWVGISGFDIEYTEKGVNVRYEQKSPIESWINTDYKLSIGFAYEGPTSTPVQKEAMIRQTTYITIECMQEKPLDEYLDLVHRIQNFLTLAVSEPVYPLELIGNTQLARTELNGHPPIYEPVKIYYGRFFVSTQERDFPWFDMLFTFRDIFVEFNTFIGNWFKNVAELGSAIDLYFGSLYNPHTYLEHQFLTVVQALESYHRTKIRREELSVDEHAKRIAEIMGSAPSKHKEWLEEKLRYSNELVLRKRLKELLDAYPEIVSSIEDEKDNLVDRVVATRNYLTHHDSALKERAAEGKKLPALTQKMQVLLQACLLTALGCGNDMIWSLFQKNRRYKRHVPIRLD